MQLCLHTKFNADLSFDVFVGFTSQQHFHCLYMTFDTRSSKTGITFLLVFRETLYYNGSRRLNIDPPLTKAYIHYFYYRNCEDFA